MVTHLLGSARLFIQIPQVHGTQVQLVEAAVLSGNETDSELLISLDLLIAWDLVPEGFPNITLNEYFTQLMTNKHFSKQYSSLYSKQAKEFETQISDDLSENRYKIPEPSKACQKLRDKLMKKHAVIFKEKLSPGDRINAPPNKIKAGPHKKCHTPGTFTPIRCPLQFKRANEQRIK